jgi:hypothetical protein
MPQRTNWRDELDRRVVNRRELAERAGLHPITVRRGVRGERTGSTDTRRRLLTALDEFPILLSREERS